MIDLGHGLRLITEQEFRLHAQYSVEAYIKLNIQNPAELIYLTPNKLATQTGLSEKVIRAGIKGKHYGQLDPVTGRCHATVSECRAWHHGGRQEAHKKKATAKSDRLYKNL